MYENVPTVTEILNIKKRLSNQGNIEFWREKMLLE